MPEVNAETGARVLFLVDGIAIGAADDMNIRKETPHQAVDPVGTLYRAENVPVGHSVSGTLSMFRLYQQGLIAAGIDVSDTTTASRLRRTKVNLVVEDILEGVAIETLYEVTFDLDEVNYTKGVLSKRVMNFEAIRSKTEEG